MSAPLTLTEYARRARETAVYPARGEFAGLAYTGLGLAGEAGAAADQIKKVLRDDDTSRTPARVAKIAHELGDTLWYVAAVCAELGLDMEEVAQANLEMLAERRKQGLLQGEGWQR